MDHAVCPSRLYTFVDADYEFALYFLEGQRLIEELAVVHELHGRGFAYFRDVVLSVQPMIAFLKRGEQFGFYLDADEPPFRLKIETNWNGDTRSVLVPETFREFPEELWGLARVVKLFPNNTAPYQSILKVTGVPLREVVNRVLLESYQVRAAVVVSGESDQSAMLHRLPGLRDHESDEEPAEAMERMRERLWRELDGVFGRALEREADVVAAFDALGWHLLASREVRFHCTCSHDRFVRNILLLKDGQGSLDHLFDPGQEVLDVVCEYCKQRYAVSREDLRKAEGAPN
jgi:molecular chaperone Hsp33